MNESAKFTKNAYIGWTMTTGLYLPETYDPQRIQELKAKRIQRDKKLGKHKKEVVTMRMVIPFTFVCESCHELNNTGKKLNMKMEQVKGEKHLGLPIYRFTAKCTECSAPWTMRTDPANSDYIMESGGRRCYEAGGDEQAAQQIVDDLKEEAEQDQMKQLHLAAEAAAQQMKISDALEETLMLKKREGGHNRTGMIMKALHNLFEDAQEGDEDENDQLQLQDMSDYVEDMRRYHEEQRQLRDEMLDERLRMAESGETGSSSSTLKVESLREEPIGESKVKLGAARRPREKVKPFGIFGDDEEERAAKTNTLGVGGPFAGSGDLKKKTRLGFKVIKKDLVASNARSRSRDRQSPKRTESSPKPPTPSKNHAEPQKNMFADFSDSD